MNIKTMNLFLKLIILLFLAFQYFSSIANSHTPISLKTLITDSDIIIIGKVISTKEKSKPKNNAFYVMDIWLAKVEIIDALKGNKANYINNIIEIEYSKNIPCTGSAEYIDSLFVLSFLSIDDSGIYHTIYGPYGVKNLNEAEINAYQLRILEFLKQDGFENDSIKLVDWYINCLSHPATSWEGAYELSPENYFNNAKDSIIYKVNLSNKQQNKLRKAILDIENLKYQDLELLPLIYNEDDKELLKYLAKQIKTVSYKNNLISERILYKTTPLINDDTLNQIADSYNDLIDNYIQKRNYYNSNNDDEISFENSCLEIYKKFQSRLLEISNRKAEQKIQSNNNSIFYLSLVLITIIIIVLIYLKIKNRK